MTKTDIAQIIIEYIAEEIGYDDPIDLDADLLESRILDSFSIVQMAMFIQERFDIELDADEMVRENLSTLTNMVSLIERKNPT